MVSARFIRNFSITLIIFTFARFAITDENPDPQKSSTRLTDKYSTPEECARPCIEGEEPKTCYYHFTVEYYSTMSGACELCRTNRTSRLTETCQCIEGDGYEISGIITANRMFPGPSIIMCLNDYAVIDVTNQVPGNGITIHWHGMLLKGYQYYDGVPYITQCPIQEDTTFRYQFRAKNSGTHFWHAHTGLHEADGLDGALIVREPKTIEPNNNLWDFDNNNHVIFLTDIIHYVAPERFPGNGRRRPTSLPDNILINGMGQWTDPKTNSTKTTPLAVFTVRSGNRYRFRLINGCTMTCALQLVIEKHRLTGIASDGGNFKPVIIDSITSLAAERYDFVITANQTPGDYWIQIRALGRCSSRSMQQLAILRYEGGTIDTSDKPSYEDGINPGVVLNPLNGRCNDTTNPPNVVCVSKLENAKVIDSTRLMGEPDVQLFLPIKFRGFSNEELFKSGIYMKYAVTRSFGAIGMIANISNLSPPSTLLTRRLGSPPQETCSQDKFPPRCANKSNCNCIHIQKLPLNSLVEVIIVNEAQVTGLSHPFHLHGHNFYVIGEARGIDYNVSRIDVNWVKDMVKRQVVKRHFVSPPSKDTYAVPYNGFTIIRFIANNPGYWYFHCHFMYHLIVGMSLVFHVGEDADLPPIPQDFPMCGNFLPPITNG